MGFVFAVCQPGSERALKDEIAREHPGLRLAFSRPGLVTWKHDGDGGLALRSIFARVQGTSLGAAADVPAVLAAAERLGGPLRLHVFARDDEDAPGAALERDLLAAGRFHADPRARAGDRVLDVILGAGDPPWLGHHVHSDAGSPHPGGRFPVEVPADAPSRAYAKVEEAIAWAGLAMSAGQVAVEVGSAPGGATHALLRRGLSVTGVDPGAMAAVVLDHPRFRHVQKTMADARREDLPARVDWLLLDVNLAPQVALHAIRRYVSFFKATLRGAIFTLKLNDRHAAAAIPALLARVAAMGLAEARATQLPANRSEICVVARR